MQIEPDPVISVSGDAHQRGRAYGSQTRRLVRENTADYFRVWETDLGLTRQTVIDFARDLIAPVGDFDNEILEEMKGLAAGAELSLEEILAVNARYELMFVQAFAGQGTQSAECTSLAAAPPATTDGHTLIGQNWDNRHALKGRCLILQIAQPDHPNIVVHTEAGLLAHKGLNSAGIGLCVNALLEQNDCLAAKVPFYVLCRALLNSTTLDEAAQTARRADLTASGNFMLAADTGQVLDIEATPMGPRLIRPVKGRCAHANVFADTDDAPPVIDKFRALHPEFHSRYCRARELLAAEPVTIDTFKKIFSDHANPPEPICRHPEDQPSNIPELLRWETITSVIMDLTERTMYLAQGCPCRTEYKKLTFPSLKPQ